MWYECSFPTYCVVSNQIINMNKASLKEGTKSNVIIIPGIISEPPQQARISSPPADDLVPINSFDGNIDLAISFYASEIAKLTAGNTHLSQQLRQALEEKKELADLIASFEELSKDDSDEKKKRVRRTAKEIERKYVCQVGTCGKSYGTEGSMAQHMKLKHPQIDYVVSVPEPKGKKGSHKESEFEDSQNSL